MDTNKKMSEFSIVDMIKRNIQFVKDNTIFDKESLKYSDEGEIKACNEMLDDIKTMNEKEFTGKYLKIIADLRVWFDSKNETDIYNRTEKEAQEIEWKSGYNNAIAEVLKCIYPGYIYPDYTHDMEEVND